MSRPASRPALLLLVAVALLVRLAPLDHGMPRSYVPDTHVVRNAMGMLRDRNPVPEVGRYSTYPYLLPYLLAPIYASEYVAGRAAGAWGGAEEFGVRASLDPRVTTLPARALLALFGALTAWALFRAARQAELGPGAWAAGWLIATSLLDVQLSTHERPWAALIFFGALALWGAVAHERSGSLRSLLGAGAAAGLAFATHQAGLIFLGLAGLSWAFAPGGWRGQELTRRVLKGCGCVALFLVVSVVLGHPYYLIHGAVDQAALAGGERAAEQLSIGGQAVRFGVSLASLRRLSVALVGYEPALLILGVAGLVPMMLRRGTRAAGVFLVATAAFFLTNPGDHVRYLLPVCLLLALAGGEAAERLFARRAGAPAAMLLLAVPLVQVLRFDWVLARTDTRALAEMRLATLPESARTAIDHYGPAVDLSHAALERVGALRGELRTRERVRLEQLGAGALPPEERGVDAIFVQELFEVDPASGQYVVRPKLRELGATPPEVLEALGVTHLLLVERRPGSDEVRPLDSLADGRRTLWTISPAPGAGRPREAFLPTEMDFPLTALWEVDRPGPWMRLVELVPPAGNGR